MAATEAGLYEPVRPPGLEVLRLPGSSSQKDPDVLEEYERILEELEESHIPVSWYYTGHLARLVREEELPLGSCPDSLGEDQDLCLLYLLADLVGDSISPNTLELHGDRSAHGLRKLRFRHKHQEVPVIGGQVRVTLNREGKVEPIVKSRSDQICIQ